MLYNENFKRLYFIFLGYCIQALLLLQFHCHSMSGKHHHVYISSYLHNYFVWSQYNLLSIT